MSMFTRNDKLADTNTDDTAQPREIPPVPAAPSSPAVSTARPVQASVQPLSNSAASRGQGISVISKALKITGQLESTEDIRIDGEVDGDVRGVSVTVGSGAKITGTVYGSAVELSGTIDGKIEAEKVVLTSSAHMSGDVVHQEIRVEAGAFIEGHCRPGLGKREEKTTQSASKPVATSAASTTPARSSDASATRA